MPKWQKAAAPVEGMSIAFREQHFTKAIHFVGVVKRLRL